MVECLKLVPINTNSLSPTRVVRVHARSVSRTIALPLVRSAASPPPYLPRVAAAPLASRCMSGSVGSAEAAAEWSLERRRPIPPAKRTAAPSGEAAGPRHGTAACGVLGWKSPPSNSSLKVIHGCSNSAWSGQRPFAVFWRGAHFQLGPAPHRLHAAFPPRPEPPRPCKCPRAATTSGLNKALFKLLFITAGRMIQLCEGGAGRWLASTVDLSIMMGYRAAVFKLDLSCNELPVTRRSRQAGAGAAASTPSSMRERETR